jgi:hypothetical protein
MDNKMIMWVDRLISPRITMNCIKQIITEGVKV